MEHVKITEAELTLIWKQYKKEGSEDVRNRLAEQYLPLVKYVSDRIAAKLPKNVVKEDLFSWGVFGLMDAIEKFDLGRKVKFQTYCINRIKGAILDELRNQDWVPRLVRSRSHKMEKAFIKLETELGHSPNDLQIADELGVSLEEMNVMLREVNTGAMLSLDRTISENPEDDETSSGELIEDKKTPKPSEGIQSREMVEFVTHKLSQKERMIMLLYYCEDITMKEIGAILDLSESRVCQIHAKLLVKLRLEWKKIRKVITENM